MAETRGLLRAHIDLPDAKWRPITYKPVDDPALRPFTVGHDLFGDGSLTILPTPGHTPGSLSMFVRRGDGPPLLLVGDLTYDVHALERGVSGGVGSKRALRDTCTKVMALRENHPAMPILAAHDPAAAGLLDAATATREVASPV
jgi:glyoxylase-like metal-dependent hydrolase (beta-lactamase superfamily II)